MIFHLIEDEVFENYMRALFGAAKKFVIIYSSDSDDNSATTDAAIHFKNRVFTHFVKENFPEWTLREKLENPHKIQSGKVTTPEEAEVASVSDFHFFEKSQ